jgi:hypothetical protein
MVFLNISALNSFLFKKKEGTPKVRGDTGVKCHMCL